jgi:hypothetical protein
MLQYLGVRLHERVRLADYGCTPAALFPAEKYAAQIDSALHSLVQLSDVHILLWGERSEVELAGCESCDEGSSALPDFLVKYRFRRTLGERKFKLIEMTASSSEWLEMEMGRYGTDLNVEAVEALNQVRKTFAGW